MVEWCCPCIVLAWRGRGTEDREVPCHQESHSLVHGIHCGETVVYIVSLRGSQTTNQEHSSVLSFVMAFETLIFHNSLLILISSRQQGYLEVTLYYETIPPNGYKNCLPLIKLSAMGYVLISLDKRCILCECIEIYHQFVSKPSISLWFHSLGQPLFCLHSKLIYINMLWSFSR